MATLKISDLSVGDWVQDNYGNYVKVEGIWQGSNFNYHVDILRDGRIGTIVLAISTPSPSLLRYWRRMGGVPMECTHFCALMNIATLNITTMNTACASIIAE